jgi:hypothetical protein
MSRHPRSPWLCVERVSSSFRKARRSGASRGNGQAKRAPRRRSPLLSISHHGADLGKRRRERNRPIRANRAGRSVLRVRARSQIAGTRTAFDRFFDVSSNLKTKVWMTQSDANCYPRQPVNRLTLERRLTAAVTALAVDIDLRNSNAVPWFNAPDSRNLRAYHSVSRKFTKSSCCEPESAWNACAAALP